MYSRRFKSWRDTSVPELYLFKLSQTMWIRQNWLKNDIIRRAQRVLRYIDDVINSADNDTSGQPAGSLLKVESVPVSAEES